MPVPEVVLYTRRGCHLCEEAAGALRRLGGAHEFTLRTVEVDGDVGLVERYGDAVPVVTVDGVEVCRGPLDVAAVRRALFVVMSG